MVENLRRNEFTISYSTLNKENDSIDKKKRAERQTCLAMCTIITFDSAWCGRTDVRSHDN